MAADPIEGNSITGKELIYPGEIWEPFHFDTTRQTIHFSELKKVVSDDARDAIVKSGGFKGNFKLYDRNEDGSDIHARFSWWSVCVPQDETDKLNANLSEGQELADIYLPESRYGTNIFHLRFSQLLSAYGKCCGCQPEIRVLGTYVYKREVMHAYVVVPSGDDTFSHHPAVARYNDDDLCEVQVWVGNGYEMQNLFERHFCWRPFSVIKWNVMAFFSKKRMWAHQAFAFYLEPLPNWIMLVDEINDEKNWEKCSQSEIDLVTSLIDE